MREVTQWPVVKKHSFRLGMARRRGLTRVEVVVAVAVTGLLLGLLVPAIQAGRRGSRGAVCLQNVSDIAQVAQVYSMYNSGRWPSVDNWYDLGFTDLEPFRST